MAPTLLAELALIVIDQLGSQIDSLDLENCYKGVKEIHKTLCACAVVCKDFLHRSRVNLYRVVLVEGGSALWNFQDTLEARPQICELVEDIRVFGVPLDDPPLYEVLSMMRSTIRHFHFFYWPDIIGDRPKLPPPALKQLSIGFPKVTSLTLYCVSATRAIYILRGFPRLESLVLGFNNHDMSKRLYLSLRHLTYLDVRAHCFLWFVSCILNSYSGRTVRHSVPRNPVDCKLLYANQSLA